MPGANPPDQDALMNVRSQDYLDWVDRQQVFESMAAINDMGDSVLQGDHRDRIRTSIVVVEAEQEPIGGL